MHVLPTTVLDYGMLTWFFMALGKFKFSVEHPWNGLKMLEIQSTKVSLLPNILQRLSGSSTSFMAIKGFVGGRWKN